MLYCRKIMSFVLWDLSMKHFVFLQQVKRCDVIPARIQQYPVLATTTAKDQIFLVLIFNSVRMLQNNALQLTPPLPVGILFLLVLLHA